MLRKVLFICVENAARSQMAEAFAKHYGQGRIEAMSAGTMPAKEVDPIVVRAMKERGIDISRNRPKPLTPEMMEEADLIVAMGCSIAEACPAPPLGKVVDWKLEDPRGKPMEKVREIRDEIEKRVLGLIGQAVNA